MKNKKWSSRALVIVILLGSLAINSKAQTMSREDATELVCSTGANAAYNSAAEMSKQSIKNISTGRKVYEEVVAQKMQLLKDRPKQQLIVINSVDKYVKFGICEVINNKKSDESSLEVIKLRAYQHCQNEISQGRDFPLSNCLN